MPVPATNIKMVCRLCIGTGLVDTYPADELVEDTCPRCDGNGIEPVSFGAVEGVVPIAISGIFESYQVLECVDTTEYNGLTAAQKEGVAVLLSCGKVDLNDGMYGRTKLWNWFGPASTTVSNLLALIASV